jgi:hypothetical protein
VAPGWMGGTGRTSADCWLLNSYEYFAWMPPEVRTILLLDPGFKRFMLDTPGLRAAGSPP